MYISQIQTTPPETFATDTQRLIYQTLEMSKIPWTRVDNDPAITVDECEEISQRLNAPTVKSLLVANRQLTKFYLVVMPGHKPFVTKDFTAALGVSRVSFVKPEILMELLGLEIGSATPLAIVADRNNVVRLVIEREVLDRPSMLLPDGTTTCYMNIPANKFLTDYIPLTGHSAEIVDM
ncbi:MAG: prolyl-tRNA synthetase associated domain-containing protein [Muribaculaceae bacterium]|nr:prolyl-tRNA synthetase associated domain-containing protein [Muribaculaceae bacterium]